MMREYSLKMPNAVYCGENSLSKLAIIAAGHKKAAVFADDGVIAAGLTDHPLSLLKDAGLECLIMSGLHPEPDYIQVQQMIDRFKETGADIIVAIGGGSIMDAAKLTSLCATDEYTVRDLLDDPQIAKKHVPTVMIPTTAGTGSEATPNAIVAVPEKEIKVGIVNESMIADYAILDAQMVKKLPRRIAAATGLDALAHVIECFTGNKANPISDIFALRGLELIMNNIVRACDDPEALDAKSAMLLGSFCGGVAITASGTTAVHALSYPLGGKYHIAHGVSNAILLAPVMRFNEPVCRERLAVIYDRVAGGEENCQTDEQKSAWVISWLEKTVAHLDIPTSLKSFGVPQGDLETLVRSAMQVTRLLNNNLRRVTADDVREIYKKVL